MKRITKRDKDGRIQIWEFNGSVGGTFANPVVGNKCAREAIERLADIEDKFEKGEAIEFQRVPDCIAARVYTLRQDCNSCSFDIGGDHAPWCKFEDKAEIYAGKPFCKYEVHTKFVPLEQLKDTDCISSSEAHKECEERNYNHACAIKCHLGSAEYFDDIGVAVRSISLEEAEEQMYKLTGRLSLKQVKELKEKQEVRIVDLHCDTTWPTHRTDCIYRVLSIDSEKLRVAAKGYSNFYFEDYGEEWIAYAVFSGEGK